jgi:hypothetical protein
MMLHHHLLHLAEYRESSSSIEVALLVAFLEAYWLAAVGDPHHQHRALAPAPALASALTYSLLSIHSLYSK